MLYTQNLLSVIDSVNIRAAFELIVNFYDPYRSRNKKTNVLDCTNRYLWTDHDHNLFNITKTNNLSGGSAFDKSYHIIIFEPPKNDSFKSKTSKFISIIDPLLNKKGIVIIKITDFRSKGELVGSFDIKGIFNKNKYCLIDNIIFKHGMCSYDEHISTKQNAKINHSNFMVFKRQGECE